MMKFILKVSEKVLTRKYVINYIIHKNHLEWHVAVNQIRHVLLAFSILFNFGLLGHLAGLLDGEHPEPDQVRHAEPVVLPQGRKGHGEVREGQKAQEQGCKDQRGLHSRYHFKHQ
jgi:hypothetical protein